MAKEHKVGDTFKGGTVIAVNEPFERSVEVTELDERGNSLPPGKSVTCACPGFVTIKLPSGENVTVEA